MPANIAVSVQSYIKPSTFLEGSIIVLGNIGYSSGAYLFLNIPTTTNKTHEYNKELKYLLNQILSSAPKYNSTATTAAVSSPNIDYADG